MSGKISDLPEPCGTFAPMAAAALSVRWRMREEAHSHERHRPAPGRPQQCPEWAAGWGCGPVPLFLKRTLRSLSPLLAIAIAAAQPLLAHTLPEPTEAPRADGVIRTAFHVPGATGMLELPRRGQGRLPVVLVFHDAIGTDGRSDPYAERLHGANIGVLELLDIEEGSLPAILSALAANPRIDAARAGVLGFDAGARLAAASTFPFAARALLYPGCPTLPGPGARGGAVLLLHGQSDPANPTEAGIRAAERFAVMGWRVTHFAYRGAGLAWDYPPLGVDGSFLLPGAGMDSRVGRAQEDHVRHTIGREIIGEATLARQQRPVLDAADLLAAAKAADRGGVCVWHGHGPW